MINQHNKSTVGSVTAMTNMFSKQKGDIKHMHTKVVVVVKTFVCLPEVLFPDNTINVMSSRSLNLFTLLLGRRRSPKTKNICIPVHLPDTDNCPSLVSGGSNLMISLYDSCVAGL